MLIGTDPVCRSFERARIMSIDPSDPFVSPAIETVPARKTWAAPEIRDQSVHSLTEAGPKTNYTDESSPATGPNS